MLKLDPFKVKYYSYYMDIVKLAARQSNCVRGKVGAAIVLPTGLISTGWNGTPPGEDNCCELDVSNDPTIVTLKTKPSTIHAEDNAIRKLHEQGISTKGSILFTTTAPCINCAKLIYAGGITRVIYDDAYRLSDGKVFLIDHGVDVVSLKEIQST